VASLIVQKRFDYLFVVCLLLIEDDFFLHKLEEPLHVQLWISCGDERFRPLVDPHFDPVFTSLFTVIVLEIVNDSQVVDILAAVTYVLVSVRLFFAFEILHQFDYIWLTMLTLCVCDGGPAFELNRLVHCESLIISA
jgi:hypothetical protein